MLRLLRFLVLSFALLCVALASAVVTMRVALHGRETRVPDLRGLVPDRAGQRLETAGLSLVVESHYYDPSIPAGRIVSQSPAPGTKVRRGWRVRVADSLGPQSMSVPDVVGQSRRAAEIDLRRRGLELGTVAILPVPGGEPGRVLAQNPSAGAKLIRQPRVDLLLSAPAPAEQVAYRMPDFVGQPVSRVAAAIEQAGLRVAPLQETAAPVPSVASVSSATPPLQPVVPGTVLHQLPSAGTRVESGQALELQIAR